MTARALTLSALLAGCAPSPPARPSSAPVPTTINLKDPWTLVSRTDDEIAVRYAQTPGGVRMWLDATDGHVPGVAPVHEGHTLQVGDAGRAWPLVAFALPAEPLRHVTILVQGVDLVVRAHRLHLDAAGLLHPLTPPAVSPSTKCRWSAKNSATTGIDTSTAPAAK